MPTFVALNNQTHKYLKIDSAKIEAQGALERMVPVVLSEFLKLVVHYPIVLTKNVETGRFVCMALLGFEQQENLFWQNNQWQGIYTPLNILRQPFFIGQENENTIICIDSESQCITQTQGELLFTEQGEDTEFLRNVKIMLAELINGETQTQAFIRALLELKLLMPMSLDITFANQQEQRVQGLYTIDEEKLSALNGDAISTLHHKNYLQPIYTMLASLGQIYALIQKKNERIANV